MHCLIAQELSWPGNVLLYLHHHYFCQWRHLQLIVVVVVVVVVVSTTSLCGLVQPLNDLGLPHQAQPHIREFAPSS